MFFRERLGLEADAGPFGFPAVSHLFRNILSPPERGLGFRV